MNTSRALDRHYSAAVEALSRYLAEPDASELRTVADHMVAAREFFLTKDGTPDWLGRTHAYRVWARSITAEAGIPGDQRTKVQAAIRYHASAAVRERLSTDELDELGLRRETARELSVVKRARQSAILDAVEGGGPIADDEAAELALAIALRILDRLDVLALSTPGRKATRATLRDLARRAEEIEKGR